MKALSEGRGVDVDALQESCGLIHDKLVAVSADVGHIAKERKTDGGARFMFRGIDDVLQAVGPALNRHGVSCMATGVEVIERVDRTSTRGTTMIYSSVLCEFTFTATEDGSVATYQAIGEAQDSGDKSFTKAQSIALRTCLLNALHIPTGEPDRDPEAGEQDEVTSHSFIHLFRERLEAVVDSAGLERAATWLRENANRPDIRELTAAYDSRKLAMANENKGEDKAK